MAVFVAGADESSSTVTGEFYYGGFVAPQREWDEFFAPAWEEQVLNASPAIPYLHVTDLKSERRRQRSSLTYGQAELKLDEAVRVIRCHGALFPVVAYLNETQFRASLQAAKVSMYLTTSGGIARKRLEPDYYCFVRFALFALLYAHDEGAEQLVILIEENRPITDHIKGFRKSILKGLARVGRPDLAALLGEVIPVSKERVPVQAADLLCWYVRNRKMLEATDQRRYAQIVRSRRGILNEAEIATVDELIEMFKASDAEDDDPDDARIMAG